MKLMLIIPIYFNNSSTEKKVTDLMRSHLLPVLDSQTELVIQSLPEGATASIESRLDRSINSQYVLEAAIEAESNGFQGIFVSDMDMCGVDICREVVNIPVVGGFRPCVNTALLLANSFSIITILDNVLSMQKGHVHHFGLHQRFTSIRVANVPVCDLIEDPMQAVPSLVEEAIKAVNEGAESIILGCTGFINVADSVQKKLEADGYYIPVIDPNRTSIKQLELLVRTGQSQSRKTYIQPIRAMRYATAI